MLNTKFEAYKLRRELKKIGTEYAFERPKMNEFREPTKEREVVHKLIGLYHDYNSSGAGAIVLNVSEAAQIRSKKIPMILCLYEDAKPVELGDVIKINSKEYKVVGVVNVQEWNIIADISLEVIDDVVQH